MKRKRPVTELLAVKIFSSGYFFGRALANANVFKFCKVSKAMLAVLQAISAHSSLSVHREGVSRFAFLLV
jgi:hypothetical protein